MNQKAATRIRREVYGDLSPKSKAGKRLRGNYQQAKKEYSRPEALPPNPDVLAAIKKTRRKRAEAEARRLARKAS